ncbi:hypothetical protein LLE87_28975, partial [Paenibacillus polymyxa]|nr:hypothetical protein [Paenibacillus polymyxa]
MHAQDINQYAQQHAAEYDLIVSNPPYFEPAVACRDQAFEFGADVVRQHHAKRPLRGQQLRRAGQ